MIRKRRSNNILTWLWEPFIARRGDNHQPDKTLLIVLGILLFLGLMFLSSASSSLAFFNYGDTYRFVKQQITHGLLPGLLLFYIAIRINYKHYQKFTPLFFFGSLVLLLLVEVSNLTNDYGTAQSWIVLGGVSFQPTELVKLFFILFLAGWFTRINRNIKYFSSGTLPFVALLGLLSFFIIRQPDIGTLSIIIFISLALYYAAGAKLTHLAVILAVGSLGFWAMIKAAPYRLNRFVAWLNPDIDPQGIGWQIKQSLIAIGSGGWFGTGLGSSRQKTYLPHPANDSIFAVIGEEIGFVFTFLLLILFIILMYRGFVIIRNSTDSYAQLIALGIVVWLSVQIFVNIAGMIQLLPLTGVPLPFISLGGSNMLISLAAVGILANISKYTKEA